MEYQTGVKKKDTLEITELLNAKTGEAVKSQWCSAYNP